MVQAVERAKQVTMAELNAIIGVCGLSISALIAFIKTFLPSFPFPPHAFPSSRLKGGGSGEGQ